MPIYDAGWRLPWFSPWDRRNGRAGSYRGGPCVPRCTLDCGAQQVPLAVPLPPPATMVVVPQRRWNVGGEELHHCASLFKRSRVPPFSGTMPARWLGCLGPRPGNGFGVSTPRGQTLTDRGTGLTRSSIDEPQRTRVLTAWKTSDIRLDMRSSIRS